MDCVYLVKNFLHIKMLNMSLYQYVKPAIRYIALILKKYKIMIVHTKKYDNYLSQNNQVLNKFLIRNLDITFLEFQEDRDIVNFLQIPIN